MLPMKHSVHSYSDSVSASSDTATFLIPIWYNVLDFIILATAFTTLLTPTQYPLFRYTATFLTLNWYLVPDNSIFVTAFTKSTIPTIPDFATDILYLNRSLPCNSAVRIST